MLARQLEVVEVEQALKASLRGVEEETKVRKIYYVTRGNMKCDQIALHVNCLGGAVTWRRDFHWCTEAGLLTMQATGTFNNMFTKPFLQVTALHCILVTRQH